MAKPAAIHITRKTADKEEQRVEDELAVSGDAQSSPSAACARAAALISPERQKRHQRCVSKDVEPSRKLP